MNIWITLLCSIVFHVMVLSVVITPKSSQNVNSTNVIQVQLEQINKGPGGNTSGQLEGDHPGYEMDEFIKEVAPEIYAQEQKEKEKCRQKQSTI